MKLLTALGLNNDGITNAADDAFESHRMKPLALLATLGISLHFAAFADAHDQVDAR